MLESEEGQNINLAVHFFRSSFERIPQQNVADIENGGGDQIRNEGLTNINTQMLSLDDEAENIASRSIFHVPDYLKNINITGAYHPQIVSIGPYHHGREHLKAMESHKKRAVDRFLHFVGKRIEEYLNKLREVVDALHGCYAHLDEIWLDQEKFLMLMVVDGIFMLELLDGREGRYARNDPVFGDKGKHSIIPLIKKDTLMIENQIPILVLKLLRENVDVDELLQKFFTPELPPIQFESSGLHVLDIVRKRVIHGCHLEPLSVRSAHERIRYSITELRDVDVKVKAAPEQAKQCLKYITLYKNVLCLPLIVVDKNFESFFLNMMAFECLHGPSGHDVNDYLSLMTSLVRSEKDVRFLQSENIIRNALGSEGEVVRIFEELAIQTLNIHTSRPYIVRQELNDYCRNTTIMRQRLLYRLKHQIDSYWESPWKIIGLVVAIALLISSIVSAVYSVKKYKQKN